MADNVQLPVTGTGTADVICKTEEIDGKHIQFIKILDGTHESVTPTGVVANPFQIALPAATVTTLTPPAAITGFATETTLGAINTKLTTGTVIGDVNLGATDNAVLDGLETHLHSIDGKLVTGTVIGDVNLGATDNAVLDTIDAAIDEVNVHIHSIDGKMVTGTVIGDVNLGATDNAVLDTMVTALQLIDNMISGSEAQVDVVTLPAITGTVTANLSATDNAVLDTIDAAIDEVNVHIHSIDGKMASGTVIGDVNLGATDNAVLDTIDSTLDAIALGVRVEDAAETAGTSLFMAGAVRRDTCASSSTASGDNSTINTDAVGALWTDPQGNVAHDAADSGNPIKIGARVLLAPGAATACAAADRTDLIADGDGALLTRGVAIADLLTERVSNTNGTSTASAIFTTGAGVRNVIKTIVVHNAHASTNGYVDLLDGSGGTILMTIPLPANGGAVVPLGDCPIKTTANTALYYDVSAAITTVYLTFVGYRTKVA
jgi:hypothetical protein